MLVAVTPSAGAQTVTATTGAIKGVVIDSTLASVQGVTVSLSGPSLIGGKTTTTDESGGYNFAAIPPGDYTVTFVRAGFATIVRGGIHVSLGFSASVDAELRPAGVVDTVVVSGAPVIDVASTDVTTHFDSAKLAALPGARDIFAVLSNTPGVAMSRMDVGGNGALAMQEYTAYGLRAITGMNRNEVEGIRVGGANGANDNYFSDFASFAEIAVKAAGHSAATPVPGTMTQYVSKSGGNAYRASVYADFQDDAWEAHNIDQGQIARGVSGGPGLDVRDVNRLQRFRDFTADVGGFVRKDKAWWYAAYRDTEVAQRYVWLLDSVAAISADVATGKFTYKLSPRQTVVGYVQHDTLEQANYFLGGSNPPVQTSDTLPSLVFPISIWKAEYSAAPASAVYLEARVGSYISDADQRFKSTGPRIADTGANMVRGGFFATARLIDRPQINGSVSITKTGWAGGHTFRFGGEYMVDRVEAPFHGYGNPCNCVSTLNNGVPRQVQIFLGTNTSKNDLVTTAGFVEDTWRLKRRVTLSLGIRLDRYQPGLPAQQGPAGQIFAAIDPVLTFNNWGPRAGMSADLTGDGKTVLKLHYGKYWLYPGANFTAAFNPNPLGWSRTHLWSNDANRNGYWDPGEEGPVIAVSGGSASTRLDSDILNTHVHQSTAYVEREVAPDFAVRTGVVLNARRKPYGTINVARPLSAYAVPVGVIDPGPDGQLSTPDDGSTLSAFELGPQTLGAAPVNLTTNLTDSSSDYYTWELTATRRQRSGWSLLGSFTRTWHRESALGMGNDFTPNALVNTVGGRDRFTTWQGKFHATMNLPLDLRLVPVVRSQSGSPYARTFVRTFNYGNATIKAEPVGARRTPHITLVDLRTEKSVRITTARVTGFFDVYNVFNTNAEQVVTTSSGSAWLRPTVITGPRILRIGARLDW